MDWKRKHGWKKDLTECSIYVKINKRGAENWLRCGLKLPLRQASNYVQLFLTASEQKQQTKKLHQFRFKVK